MSFLDIKDPAKRTALVDEYLKAMKTVRRRNMVNREMKLVVGTELLTKQAAEKTVEELAPVKKALEDIDGTLKAQQRTIVRPAPLPPSSSPQKDLTFGIHATGDGRNAMGNSIVHIEGKTSKVDDKEYELTPGVRMLMLYKKPRPQHCTSDDYSVYKAIVAQIMVIAYPNKRIGSARPRSAWKWKHMIRGVAISPGDRVEEEEEDIEGTSSDGYCTPPPDFVPASDLPPLERGGIPEKLSIKGME